jgi:hypothetical protein
VDEVVGTHNSEADWERFRDDTLVPALASIGQTMREDIKIWPIETVLTF